MRWLNSLESDVTENEKTLVALSVAVMDAVKAVDVEHDVAAACKMLMITPEKRGVFGLAVHTTAEHADPLDLRRVLEDMESADGESESDPG